MGSLLLTVGIIVVAVAVGVIALKVLAALIDGWSH